MCAVCDVCTTEPDRSPLSLTLMVALTVALTVLLIHGDAKWLALIRMSLDSISCMHLSACAVMLLLWAATPPSSITDLILV